MPSEIFHTLIKAMSYLLAKYTSEPSGTIVKTLELEAYQIKRSITKKLNPSKSYIF